MTRYTKRKFTVVFCDKCDRRLAEVLVGTETYCPSCANWTVAEPSKQASKEVSAYAIELV